MNRLFVPTLGPTDWRRLLADPGTQWRPSKSALEMAVCWESARATRRGLPPEIAAVIDSVPTFAGAELLVGLPEHKVYFEGGGHPSQNDLWALLQVKSGFVSMAVEAKAGEKLDDFVGDWLKKKDARTRKPERLKALQTCLGIPDQDATEIRYQLLHRTLSALREATRFRASWAVLLVQSFDRAADEISWQDFKQFGSLMNAAVQEGSLVRSGCTTEVPLYLGWVSCFAADVSRLRAAV